MATSSFTKKFSIEKATAHKFVETLTKRGTSREKKKFNSNFKHINDSELILKLLEK